MSFSDRDAERAVQTLLEVKMGGAQLRQVGDYCQLCRPAGRCQQLVRLQLEERDAEAHGGAGVAFSARRFCDGKAVFSAVPCGFDVMPLAIRRGDN